MLVLNVVDGCIPSDMARGRAEEIEEERRLLYVAMTRAKDHLHLIVPQRFYVAPAGGATAIATSTHCEAGSSPKAWRLIFKCVHGRSPTCRRTRAIGRKADTAKIDLAARARTAWL